MTIDEVISYEKLCSKRSDAFVGYTTEEHEQLAEWLEELKEARKGFNENRKAGYKHGYSDGYNKAIDDFAEKADGKIMEFVLNHKDNLDFASGISVAWNIIDDIAQQLKEGKKDGNSTTDN